MFTGIIESVQPVTGIKTVQGKTNLTISRPDFFNDLKVGSSISCNGICLTVIELKSDSFTVEIMYETMLKSTAGKWQTGNKINLERALQTGGRLDGHWVQGHVDTVTSLLETRTINSTLYLTFGLPPADKALVVPQGSIAINGVSLTISELKAYRFTISLIGHTISHTNLSNLVLGNHVNLEYDILGKYIQRGRQLTDLSQEFLHEQGF